MVLDKFKTYKAEIGKKIQALRSDRGVEYESTVFFEFHIGHQIIHQSIASYTPQQNGVA